MVSFIDFLEEGPTALERGTRLTSGVIQKPCRCRSRLGTRNHDTLLVARE